MVIINTDDNGIEFDESVSHPNLRTKLKEWGKKSAVLLAWDAPLTGPTDPKSDNAGDWESELESDFTQRRIEQVFSRGDWKPPSGVSVQGYAGCQHWALTRNLLGLPRVGPYDSEDIPFKLLTKRPTEWKGKHVVEVHPALAMWLWTRERIPNTYYGYKSKKEKTDHDSIRRNILRGLIQEWRLLEAPTVAEESEEWGRLIRSSDLLDAYIAAVLAFLWVKGSSAVEILGDQSKGAILLANTTGLPAC